MQNWREILNLELQVYKGVAGSQLQGFLQQQTKKVVPHFLFDGAKELVVEDDRLKAIPEHSLSLLVYAALNPQVVSLGEDFESKLLGQVGSDEHKPDPDSFFSGTNLNLPKNTALDSKFRSFDQWTAVNEVKHISMWLIAALRSLLGSELQSALEVEIPLPGERRPGRLDVIAKKGSEIVCFEAKTSIEDAVKDGRFVEQVPKYRAEIIRTAFEIGLKNYSPLIFLVTGGNEDDLSARDWALKSSPVGDKLIEICERHEIKFVTANAIWQMLAKNLVRPESKIDLVQTLSKLNSTEKYIGLTSAGFITTKGSIEQGVVN